MQHVPPFWFPEWRRCSFREGPFECGVRILIPTRSGKCLVYFCGQMLGKIVDNDNSMKSVYVCDDLIVQ